MIGSVEYNQLSASKKAELIYGQARSAMSDRLWRAALGTGGDGPDAGARAQEDGMSFDALLALLDAQTGQVAQPGAAMSTASGRDTAEHPKHGPATTGQIMPDDGGTTVVAAAPAPAPSSTVAPTQGLGPNARHLPALADAAARTGIPVPALAAIVHAEAAKGRDGSWQAFSRNPRSSAAGLGQFLSGTWQGMAETKGTWLNDIARTRGWLGANGGVLSGARSALLQLRYDPAASINTTADYARHNLDGLRRAGVSIGTGAATIAQSAYLGHHLGLGDAVRFMKGGLDPARARMLLGAQIGSAKASQQIAQAGNATVAHRTWFMDFVDRHVQPARFTV